MSGKGKVCQLWQRSKARSLIAILQLVCSAAACPTQFDVNFERVRINLQNVEALALTKLDFSSN